MQSFSGELNSTDWKRWVNNVLIFSAPALIAFLGALQAGISLQNAMLAVYPAIINAFIDLLKKLQAGP